MGAFVIWGILVGILFHWIIWYEYRCGKINKKNGLPNNTIDYPKIWPFKRVCLHLYCKTIRI